MSANIKILSITLLLSFSSQASPFTAFKESCSKISSYFFPKNKEFKGAITTDESASKKIYSPPENSHESHKIIIKELQDSNKLTDNFYHLPFVEQSLKDFKDTQGKYIEYFFDKSTLNSEGYKDFLSNTAEILYFPHSSYHGHIRLRLGTKMYGFENIKYVYNGAFDVTRVFKESRALKKGKKAGNIGIVFMLTSEQKELLTKRLEEIEKFYSSSSQYNLPPFDGTGATEILVKVEDDTGKIKYHSPAPKSGFGNRDYVNAKIVLENGIEYLEAPNGYRQVITKNEKGERITRGFSCASSASHVMNDFMGIPMQDMPYAGSFLTHLKNGAKDFLEPDAIMHYYPSSDLD